MRRLLLITLALVVSVHAFVACACDDEDKIAFSFWNYAAPVDGGQFSYIAYEIQRSGFHSANVHFKNFAEKDISFDFWLPGYQSKTISVRVPVSAPNDRQWIVPVDLDCGASGVQFSQLKMTRIKLDGLARPVSAGRLVETSKVSSASDEAWLSVVSNQSLVEFSPETVTCRVVHDSAGDRVLFRNLSRQNVYFNFVVNGYQKSSPKINARVSLAMGQEQSIPVVLNHPDAQVSLARVKAFDIRIYIDSGTFLDEKEMEDGWFAVAAINCPMFNPNQLVYRFDNTDQTRMAIRFKNISRLPISFDYSIANQLAKAHVAIAADGETSVAVPHFNNALPTSLTRIRVTDVHYEKVR